MHVCQSEKIHEPWKGTESLDGLPQRVPLGPLAYSDVYFRHRESRQTRRKANI